MDALKILREEQKRKRQELAEKNIDKVKGNQLKCVISFAIGWEEIFQKRRFRKNNNSQ